jgi:EmrB/QacA subfamily drug resistance transporter
MKLDIVKTPQTVPCLSAAASASDYRPCQPVDRRSILVMTILGSSLAFMDGSIVNVALPTFQTAFYVTSSEVEWVVQSYALFCAALLLLGGTLGDRLGRKRIFAIGIGLFSLASAGAALSMSLPELVISRSIQGIGAALLIPQSLAILSAAFPGNERASAIGAWSAWTSVFAALGPIVGGLLIQASSWRWIFLLNLPLAAWILALLPNLRESNTEVSRLNLATFDVRGTMLNTVGLGSLVYALSFGPQLGWTNLKVVISMLVGISLIGAFFRSQSHNEHAMMPLSLFSNRQFLAVNVLTFFLYGSLGVAFYIVPFFAIQVKHLSPFVTGAAFLPCIAVMFLFSSKIGRISSEVGERSFLIVGAIISACGLVLFGVFSDRQGYAASLLPGMILLGLGITVALSPLANVVMSSVPDEETAVASAVNNSISRIAGLVVLSIATIFLSHGFDRSLLTQLKSSSLPSPMKDQIYANHALMTAVRVPSDFGNIAERQGREIVNHAFSNGYSAVMYAAAFGMLLAALPVMLWWRSFKVGDAELRLAIVTAFERRQPDLHKYPSKT